MIDHAEQAVDMIQAIRPFKMDLAFILCHEMCYGNAARIETVIYTGEFNDEKLNEDWLQYSGEKTLPPSSDWPGGVITIKNLKNC